MKRVLLSILLVSITAFFTYADENIVQSFEDYSKLLSPEKIYLHTDKEVYCLGDTIWFKGYLLNASDLAENPECNYIYVELFSVLNEINVAKMRSEDVERFRCRVKVKRTENGLFEGYMPLSEKLNSGIAVLRAYSYWMLNKSVEYMFYKNIEIRNPMKDSFVKSLIKVKIDDARQYAELYTANPFKKEWLRTKPRKESGIDIQFLPESGRYTYGKQSVMAVKALNKEGLGVKLSGHILADGNVIADFTTNTVGLGAFSINVPKGTKSLKAVTETAVEGFEYTAKIPLPEIDAVVLNLNCSAESYTFNIDTDDILFSDSVFFVIHDRNNIFYKKSIESGTLRINIPSDKLPAGINNAAVVDAKGNVYAERCFFVYPSNEVSVALDFDKQQYSHRDRVRCHLNVNDSTGAMNGFFSMSVSDDNYAPVSGKGHNIKSWMMLGSELEGYIENPQWYFCDTVPVSKRLHEMDLLMLTQGWKYYNLPQIISRKNPEYYFGKEYTQSLCGFVHGFLGKAKRSTVFFVAPSINFTCIGELDSCAYFALNKLDFPDSTNFLVGARGDGIFKKMHYPILNPEIFAFEYNYPKYLTYTPYSQEYEELALRSYYSTGGEPMYTIMPARVVAIKEGVSPYPNDNFRAGEYRSGEELEPYADYQVWEYIKETYFGLAWRNNAIYTSQPFVSSGMDISSGGLEPWKGVYIYLNGVSIQENATEIMETLMSDVEAIAVVQGVRAAQYQFTFEENTVPRVAIMVLTKKSVRGPRNVSLGKPMGWQKPAKKYVPKYETEQQQQAYEPMRPTLHWEPDIRLNEDGSSADIEFYTSDSDASYTVTVEGVTDGGIPVSYTCKLQPVN